MITSPL